MLYYSIIKAFDRYNNHVFILSALDSITNLEAPKPYIDLCGEQGLLGRWNE